MPRSANVKSISCLTAFRAEMQEFGHPIQDALASLECELDRALEWFQSDRMAYWPNEARRASDELAEALNRLERKKISTNPADNPSCYEEKKAVELARRRKRLAEQKIRVTRHWLPIVQHEIEEFKNQLNKLHHLSDSDVPRAVAALTRMISSLEKYSQLARPDSNSTSPPTSSKDRLP